MDVKIFNDKISICNIDDQIAVKYKGEYIIGRISVFHHTYYNDNRIYAVELYDCKNCDESALIYDVLYKRYYKVFLYHEIDNILSVRLLKINKLLKKNI